MSSRVARYPWFLMLNFGALLLFVPAASLLLYYGLAAGMLQFRRNARARFGAPGSRYATYLSIVALTAGVLILRDPGLVQAAGGLGKSFAELYKAWDLSGIGLSYCWLRTLYVFAAEEEPTLYEFSRYYFFLPTYLTGPIVTPEELLDQRGGLSRDSLVAGLVRMAIGGFRFLLAVAVQQVTPFADGTAMRHAAETFGAAGLWGAAFISGVWLYLNFAAFMDIYIGLGRLMGYRLPENFNNPFTATDLTDFWRRWHITLGRWLRALVYSPVARWLGRYLPANSLVTAGLAALATMTVCGIWHKLAVPYLIWGLLHGFGLFIHQAWTRIVLPRLSPVVKGPLYPALAWLVTHAYVALGWVFFFPAGETDLVTSLRIASVMLGLSG